ncbi:unnamed protein product, partial [Meganyctiphanes norvegica]
VQAGFEHLDNFDELETTSNFNFNDIGDPSSTISHFDGQAGFDDLDNLNSLETISNFDLNDNVQAGFDESGFFGDSEIIGNDEPSSIISNFDGQAGFGDITENDDRHQSGFDSGFFGHNDAVIENEPSSFMFYQSYGIGAILLYYLLPGIANDKKQRCFKCLSSSHWSNKQVCHGPCKKSVCPNHSRLLCE